MKSRPYVLIIAGFDPSAGAGVLADIKTLEALKVYGLAVNTANTIQNDTDFEACHWIDLEEVLQQIRLLFKRFTIDVVKIGIVEDWRAMLAILELLRQLNPSVKVVLDPVLNSTTGYTFKTGTCKTELECVLKDIFLITPNTNELSDLIPGSDVNETIEFISSRTNLLVKGGHKVNDTGVDDLYTKADGVYRLYPNVNTYDPKHGSGCVLSSAIAANLGLGVDLPEACEKAKRYVERFLDSNNSLLGYHNI